MGGGTPPRYYFESDGVDIHVSADVVDEEGNLTKRYLFTVRLKYSNAGRGWGVKGQVAQKNVTEGVLRHLIREALLLEALTKTDRRDIERMARKQAAVILKRDALDKREIEKLATKKAEEAIKKALGVSFIGTRGDINKFVTDNAEKGAEKWLKDKAGKQQVADVTKMIVKKLYKQLAVSSPQVIDRIKV